MDVVVTAASATIGVGKQSRIGNNFILSVLVLLVWGTRADNTLGQIFLGIPESGEDVPGVVAMAGKQLRQAEDYSVRKRLNAT